MPLAHRLSFGADSRICDMGANALCSNGNNHNTTQIGYFVLKNNSPSAQVMTKHIYGHDETDNRHITNERRDHLLWHKLDTLLSTPPEYRRSWRKQHNDDIKYKLQHNTSSARSRPRVTSANIRHKLTQTTSHQETSTTKQVLSGYEARCL